MIQINKGQVNDRVFTLYEKTTISPVVYLFEFTPKGDNIPRYCISENISSHVERYDKFNITETDAPDPLLGEVSLPVGESIYKVYEQSSDTNLDPTGLNCVEGPLRCWVDRANTSYAQVSNPELTNTEIHG